MSLSTRVSRRLVPACVLATAAIAALGAPGVASASRLPKCTEGTKINGEGSTLQAAAMTGVWGGKAAKGYNSGNTNPKACPGGPEVTYNTKGKTGSGKGMENWYGLEEYGPEAQGYVGTDNAPNAEIKAKIEAEGSGKVLTIPTLQAAVALIVHLPTGCAAEAAPGTKPLPTLGRLVLKQKTVEKIFRRQTTKWSKIKDGGDKIITCSKAASETEITRVVRKDGSGTTATFKKWLEVVNGKGTAEAGKVCDAAKETWLECGEEPPANTSWPAEGEKLIRGEGGGGVVKAVEETPSSIGYANLADVRSKGPGFIPPTGGEGKNMFWVEIENVEKEAVGGKKLAIYTDPSDNGDAAAKSKANCAETAYVNVNPTNGKAEKGKFPPPTTEELWNRVTAEKKEVNYTLCGFTYDLGLTKYNGFKGATESEATTAGDFLEFVLDAGTTAGAEGGQTLIEKEQDYISLPTNKEAKKNVQLIAQEGAKKVQF
ncbi:MAG TPA: substrate-binding domain-containing protein [Solirubrobacteraceae bacterium]|nr:substrate-binding domain-containing protein [Solirubrobacteraceae bacterium]